MRVLILTNKDTALYRFRKELISKMVEMGHNVYASLPNDPLVPSIQSLGCKFIETPINRRSISVIEDMRLLFQYNRIVREVKPDIVLTYTIKPNIYGGFVCRLHRVKYVENITGLGTMLENKSVLQRVLIRMYKIALSRVQTVFLQNEENMQFFIAHKIAVGKLELLPGSGVNLSEYVPLEYPPDDTVNFVYIGRLMKEKGIEQYLAAAKVIRARHPQTRFHICGRYEDEYAQTVEAMEREKIIVFHGMVTDMRSIYQMVHCTIHPTYYPEGMSNVLLESAASARPIITTDRAGCREVIKDGVSGYFVKSKDSDDLIDKIEKFISLTWNEKRQMGLDGRKIVEAQFDRNIVVNKYLERIEAVKTNEL